MNESDIKNFWNKHPCGETLVGGLVSGRSDCEEFFSKYDQYRYKTESHIPTCLNRIKFKSKRVLEIGLGQGADSEQIIRRGARWSGLDLTSESVERVKIRLALRNLSYENIRQGSVLSIPFDNEQFDIVYTHGVLHHVPDILQAQKEIHRVLKPNGEVVAMLYAKWSLNYLVSISILRRLGLIALYASGYSGNSKYGQHVVNAKQLGLWNYMRMKNFIHRNTDGPLNPYAKIYDLPEVRKDFPNFEIMRAFKRFMHAPPLPVGWLPLGRIMGWHLWVHLMPIGK